MKTTRLFLFAAFTLLFLVAAARADINYQFVTVGNPGNANDTVVDVNSGLHFGGVSYTYNIGRYDVTLSQYTAFLNAVAATDTYSLYNPFLATNLNIAGILQNGSSGNYTYSVIGNGQHPVTYVSWLDAARFTNWLHNGQPTGIGEVAGSTEQGAYTLNGDTTSGLETNNANAQYWIPSENEWYKAAYYDPNYGGPGVGGYWLYATRSNSPPDNNYANRTLPNEANSFTGLFCVTQSSTLITTQNYLTEVGAFTNSASTYGTYDQAGDVYQWNDAVIGSSRGVRGGSWNTGGGSNTLQSASRPFDVPNLENSGAVGFRVAAVVPEPSTVALLGAGFLSLLAWRKRE